MEVKKTVNRRNLYKEGEYPYNLLSAVKDGAVSDEQEIEFPKEMTADNLAGLEYVIDKLPLKSQEILRQRYQEKKTRTEIAKSFSVTDKSISAAEYRALRISKGEPNAVGSRGHFCARAALKPLLISYITCGLCLPQTQNCSARTA